MSVRRKKTPRDRDPGMAAAVEAVGLAKIGEPFGISAQAVGQWKSVPAERLRQISEVTGLPYEVLRPDLFPQVERKTEAA